MMPRFPQIIAALVTCAVAACDRSTPRTAADSQAAHIRDVVAAGGVVDSIHPIEEHLRRFRAMAGAQVDTLRHASISIDALVDRWAHAVATHDTTALNQIVIDRAEFAWLMYPSSPLSKPPYEAPPELLWGQILASSNDGAKTVLQRFGGKPLRIVRLECPAPKLEDSNRLHEHCLVTVRSDSNAPMTARLFGTIFEHAGRFKFVGLSSGL